MTRRASLQSLLRRSIGVCIAPICAAALPSGLHISSTGLERLYAHTTGLILVRSGPRAAEQVRLLKEAIANGTLRGVQAITVR